MSTFAESSDTPEDMERKAMQMRSRLLPRGAPAEFLDMGIRMYTEAALRMRRDGARTYGEWIAMVQARKDQGDDTA
jgi:hypothetical protein